MRLGILWITSVAIGRLEEGAQALALDGVRSRVAAEQRVPLAVALLVGLLPLALVLLDLNWPRREPALGPELLALAVLSPMWIGWSGRLTASRALVTTLALLPAATAAAYFAWAELSTHGVLTVRTSDLVLIGAPAVAATLGYLVAARFAYSRLEQGHPFVAAIGSTVIAGATMFLASFPFVVVLLTTAS